MLNFRKNVNGNWNVCTLKVEEAKAIQDKIINIGLSKYVAIKKAIVDHNSKLTEGTPKLEVSEIAIAKILDKVVPSYESLANDFIEEQIKKQASE